MHEAVIEAEPRTETGTLACRRLRQNGKVPGIVYGHGEGVANITVDAHDLLQALHTGAHMFDLKVADGTEGKVLVKELQYDSLGDHVVHIDLLRVDLTEQVEVTVSIVLAGAAIGAVHRGVVDQPLKDARLACLATQIPDEIRVSITALDIGDMISVKDLELPEGVVVLNPPEQVVVTVHPPITEAAAEAAEAASEEGTAEPEVIGGAPETEGEGGGGD